jgi:hypothetical protein
MAQMNCNRAGPARVSVVMDRDALLQRARTKGVNRLVYWIVRAILEPFFLL